MSDVNLNSPDLQLVHSSERAPARTSSPSRAEGATPSAQAPVKTPADASQSNLQKNSEDQRDELDSAVSRLNDFVQTVQRDLQFDVDDKSGKSIVRVVDQQTQEVIRQIPDELALRLADNLQQEEPLTLLNIKV